ncbi:MAG: helix-turn-helix domain-containing protein [Hymenobacter sp.]
MLRQAQRACRGKAGYVPVTVLLLLDRGRAVAAIAEDLGLDEATVYRYAQTYRLQGPGRLSARPSSPAIGACSPAPNSRA